MNLHKKHKPRILTVVVLQATPSRGRPASLGLLYCEKISHKRGNKSKGTGATDRALHP